METSKGEVVAADEPLIDQSLIVDQKEVREIHLLLGHIRKRLLLAVEQGRGMDLEKRSMKDELEERMLALSCSVKEIQRLAVQ